MEGSEPLVQFAEEDEPLLDLGGDKSDSKLAEGGPQQPPEQVDGREKDTDEDEPMVQLHFKDYDDDRESEPQYTPVVKQTTSRRGLFWIITVCVLFAVALFIVVIGLALSARTLGMTPSTPTPPSTPTTFPASASPPTAKPPPLVSVSSCGSGQWLKVAYFDMIDTSQECPRGWRGYDSPVRCCGRPVSARSSSPSVYFGTNGFQYSKVCGRARGYQVGSPDCFGSVNSAEPDTETVDGLYVDGVSVTHGNPRTHIWTFAAGLHERSGQSSDRNNCPCDGGVNPPAFVGNSFSCETGDDTPNIELKRFYDSDPLWDGQNCNNATCCASSPWFRVNLATPTTDDIEVRICGDQSTGDEDTPLALLELYVQQ